MLCVLRILNHHSKSFHGIRLYKKVHFLLVLIMIDLLAFMYNM